MTPKQKARKYLLNEALSIVVGLIMGALFLAVVGLWIFVGGWMLNNYGQAAGAMVILSPIIPITAIGTYVRYRDKIKEFSK